MVRPSDFAISFETEQRSFVCIYTSIGDPTIWHILVIHGRDHVASRVHGDVTAEVIAVTDLALQVGWKPFAGRETAAGCDPASGHPDVIDDAVERLEHLRVRAPESFAHKQYPGTPWEFNTTDFSLPPCVPPAAVAIAPIMFCRLSSWRMCRFRDMRMRPPTR